MRYIHSFLRKIKEIGNYIWNSVRTDGKIGNRTVAYLTAAAVLTVGTGLTGTIMERNKKRNERLESIEVSVNAPAAPAREQIFFKGTFVGQLVSTYLRESEEDIFLEEDLDEVLVLFGTVAGNIEPYDFTSIVNEKIEPKASSSSSALLVKQSSDSRISEEPRLLLGIVNTAATGEEEIVFAASKKLIQNSLPMQQQSTETISAANQKSVEKAVLSKNKAEMPEASGKTSAAKAVVTDKATENKTAVSDKTEAGSGSAVEKKAIETGTQVAETIKKTDLEGGLVLNYNPEMIMTLTKEEMEIMERIVEAEATDEDIYGKVLVANVVLNRVLCSGFPNTVKKVVFQKGQFSPIRDGRYYSVKVTSSTKEAVKRALAGEDYSDGALFFFARKKTTVKKASWFDNSLQRLFRYGGHEFFKNK